MATVDQLLKAQDKRIADVFNAALERALKTHKNLFRRIKEIDSGKIKCPVGLDPKKWRQDTVNKLIRESGVIESLTEELQKAGMKVNQATRSALATEYAGQYKAECTSIAGEAARVGFELTFAKLDKNALNVILDTKLSRPFTKIAFSATEDGATIAARLQDEMMQSIMLGESRKKVLRRISDVTQYQANRCRRIAQTESNRIRSEAINDVGQRAADMGVRVYTTWSCRMLPATKHSSGSRASHIELDGKSAMQGEPFVTINGNKLLFPGDPTAPPSEICNCMCQVTKHVLLPDEELIDGQVVKKR